MPRYIDFISAYCDRWCERCAFTDRCSQFAVSSALAMCDGDFAAAMELAVGPSRRPGAAPQKSLEERLSDRFFDYEPTAKELDEIGRELEERRERIRRDPLAEISLDYAIAAHRWLTQHEELTKGADAAVREAIDIIKWDAHFIHVKIMRALDGRDEHLSGAFPVKRAVQSDWNGSAKVALLSIQRSERAWAEVAGATKEEAAAVLARSLTKLREGMDKAFPRAMDFRRPGFDSR
jgi:hypothetical protein